MWGQRCLRSGAEVLVMDEQTFPLLKGYFNRLPRIRNPDGSLKHIVCEGSRDHVISYSKKGQHCSEPECEINRNDNLSRRQD